ncbi:unnamed protein product [Plutella xylostella]|uniref:(diamondback moth) hypothetical protein n=1 Tax=Plutella xylostella TaxID=51655 RepID=A0A8S4FPY4_PLUXY|nr:unnamed protein product [Plutella xylostella]
MTKIFLMRDVLKVPKWSNRWPPLLHVICKNLIIFAALRRHSGYFDGKVGHVTSAAAAAARGAGRGAGRRLDSPVAEPSVCGADCNRSRARETPLHVHFCRGIPCHSSPKSVPAPREVFRNFIFQSECSES